MMALDFKMVQGIVYLTFRGHVTGEDIRDMTDLIRETEIETKVSPNRIADLTAVEGVSLRFTAIMNYAIVRRSAPLKNSVRAAIVAPHPLQYGIARMFQSLNDNPDIHMEIFTDRGSGLAWISGGKGGFGDRTPWTGRPRV